MMFNQTQQLLEKARELIQAKRYEDARALLLTVDDPRADKWLERLNRVLVSQADIPSQSFTTKLVLTIILLFVLVIPGLIALVIFSREAKDALARSKQPIPGARALILLDRYSFIIIILGATIFLILIFQYLMNNPATAPFMNPLF